MSIEADRHAHDLIQGETIRKGPLHRVVRKVEAVHVGNGGLSDDNGRYEHMLKKHRFEASKANNDGLWLAIDEME